MAYVAYFVGMILEKICFLEKYLAPLVLSSSGPCHTRQNKNVGIKKVSKGRRKQGKKEKRDNKQIITVSNHSKKGHKRQVFLKQN